MPSLMRRIAAGINLRGHSARRSAFILFQLFLFAVCAHAVVVRGHVTDATGKPIAGARVQLIEAGSVGSVVYADDKGHYEIRFSEAGRFTLMGSEATYLPAIGEDFYGGATDVIDLLNTLPSNFQNNKTDFSNTTNPLTDSVNIP